AAGEDTGESPVPRSNQFEVLVDRFVDGAGAELVAGLIGGAVAEPGDGEVARGVGVGTARAGTGVAEGFWGPMSPVVVGGVGVGLEEEAQAPVDDVAESVVVHSVSLARGEERDGVGGEYRRRRKRVTGVQECFVEMSEVADGSAGTGAGADTRRALLGVERKV